jgi:hypothetical protein
MKTESTQPKRRGPDIIVSAKAAMQPFLQDFYHVDTPPPSKTLKTGFQKRNPKPNEALSPQIDIMRRETYKYGDGDTILPKRPGSMDFMKWPSRGQRC